MDSSYENLSQNVFLQEIRQLYQATFESASQKSWIICVPRSGTFARRKFHEDEIYAHVLIPRKTMPNQFNNLNGKEIELLNKVLIIKDGDEKYLSHLIFEEILYTKGYKCYIWYIEKPLEKSMCVSDNHISIITNLQEAINFLQMELLEGELFYNIEAKIQNFLHINNDLDYKSVQIQKALVYNLYMDCLQMLLEDTTLKQKISDNEYYSWNIRVSLEMYIMYSLRHVLLKSLSACTIIEDATLNKIMRNLEEIELSDLLIPSDIQFCVYEANLNLSRLDSFVTVFGKIECIRKTINCISQGLSDVSLDDILSVLIFLIIKAGLSNWTAQLIFMKEFRFSIKSFNEQIKMDKGGNFLITLMETVIEYISSGKISRDCLRTKYMKEYIIMQEHNMVGQLMHTSTYLFKCIEIGDLSKVKRILTHHTSNWFNDIDFCHPLCKCISYERSRTKYLDLNMHFRNESGFTPLHFAILNDQAAIVNLLLEYTTNINITDSNGLTPLHFACIRGHQDILLRILHANGNPFVTDLAGNTPLHTAANRDHKNCIKTLLYLSKVDMNAANVNGDTAMHIAAKWGYDEIVSILLEYGANYKLTNRNGQTPLMMTYSKYIAELIKCYAAKTVSDIFDSWESISLPSSPCQQMTSDEMDTLRPESNADEQHRINRLFHIVIESNMYMLCYYFGLKIDNDRLPENHGAEEDDLCDPICNCKFCSMLGKSPLKYHKYRRHTINTSNSCSEIALHIASAFGRAEVVQFLLNAEANVNATTTLKSRTPLHLACLNGHVNVMELLLNCATCDVNAKDEDGNTPLHLSTRTDNVELVRLLITHGANVNFRNHHNLTPAEQLELEIPDISSTNYSEILKILNSVTRARAQSTDDED